MRCYGWGATLGVGLLAAGCSPASALGPACGGAGTICTYAGNGTPGYAGEGMPLAQSQLFYPANIKFDATNSAYVLDWNNYRVRRVLPNGNFVTVMGELFPGDGPDDGSMSDTTAPGAPGITVQLNHPTDLTFGADGLVYLASWHNHKIRQFDPQTGLEVIICGSSYGFAGDNGPAPMAKINQAADVEFDSLGNLYISDMRNQRIRRIGLDAAHTITTVVGTGTPGFAGDGGDPLHAQLQMPFGDAPTPGGGIAFDSHDVLYIADTENHRIRVVDFAANTIDTLAGTGAPGYAGDGGPAANAQLNHPRFLVVGPDGNLYFTDTDNDRVRMINLTTHVITTVAGNGVRGYSGDGALATAAQLNQPFGVSFDRNGDMFIADTYNSRIRRVVMH